MPGNQYFALLHNETGEIIAASIRNSRRAAMVSAMKNKPDPEATDHEVEQAWEKVAILANCLVIEVSVTPKIK